MTGLNPFDWHAAEFLMLYGALLVGAIVAGFVIGWYLRPEGHDAPVTSDDELALLAGGRDRLGETVLARMMAAGHARIQSTSIYLTPMLSGASGLDREILALPSPASWSNALGVIGDGAERIERDLVARGLMLERGERRELGLFAALPLLILIGFGVIRRQLGVAREHPVGILTGLLVVTAIVAVIRVFAVDRRTKAGFAVVREARARSTRLRQAPTHAEAGTAVALFGTAVLVGSPMSDLHRLRQSDGGSEGGDGGSGCGGGGCGGGGCGG